MTPSQQQPTTERARDYSSLMNDDTHPWVALKRLERGSLTDHEFTELAETEAANLEELRRIDYPHLIKAIAYFTKGNQHYFIFPWADFGSLKEFCTEDPLPLNETYIEWIFGQLRGISEAVCKLHHSEESNDSWRHGDLKPENILCFKDHREPRDGRHGTCIFVISDVGLTKKHNTMTEDRKHQTRTNIGTIMYEPPEAELDEQNPEKGRSRRYDIWSLGCINLELIIRLLYGAKELARFRNDLSGHGQFYVLVKDQSSAQQGAALHNMVLKWVDWIRNDLRCPEQSAVRRLLELIVDKLLIPENELSPELQHKDSWLLEESIATSADKSPNIPAIKRTATSYATSIGDREGTRRVTAKDLVGEMDSIIKPGKDEIWLNFDAPSKKGPGQFAKQLASSDANLTVTPSSKSNQVRTEHQEEKDYSASVLTLQVVHATCESYRVYAAIGIILTSIRYRSIDSRYVYDGLVSKRT